MLTATEANKLRANIARALRNIGQTNGTRLPTSKNNAGSVALQYWLTTHMARIVDGLEKEARKAALDAGVLFNHRDNPLPAGTDRQIFTSDVVNVMVRVNRPSMVLNKDDLRVELRKLKLTDEQIDTAIANASREAAAPHVFTPVLVEKGD